METLHSVNRETLSVWGRYKLEGDVYVLQGKSSQKKQDSRSRRSTHAKIAQRPFPLLGAAAFISRHPGQSSAVFWGQAEQWTMLQIPRRVSSLDMEVIFFAISQEGSE